MVSPKQLLSVVESALLGSSPPTPSQSIELMHAVRNARPTLQNLLSYPPPRPADRTEVQSKEVRLQDSTPVSLDDQDVQIALKLSDDLHLNEIECVRLLMLTNQQWALWGREPMEILRLASGLWYTERRDIITVLHTLLRAVVLDRGYEDDLVADIKKYLEDLVRSGLRQRLITLIKELRREEPAGQGGPSAERYVIDSRGSVVERRAVVSRERLSLVHCLVLSDLVVRMTPKDVKDVFSLLKDSAAELNTSSDTLKYQITYGLLFCLIIAFVSDALSSVPEKEPVLANDNSFKMEFQEIVMGISTDSVVEGFIGCVRLAWAVHMMLIHDGASSETVPNTPSNSTENVSSCLEVIFSKNVFQFILDKVLRTAAYKNDDEDMIYMYNAYLHKLITGFLSQPLSRDKVKEIKEKASSTQNPNPGGVNVFTQDSLRSERASEYIPPPFVSLLEVVSEIYKNEPELLMGNDVVWTFVTFAGEDHSNFQTLVAFLRMLGTLASSQEGASRVFGLLQGKIFRSVSWTTLFKCLSIYAEKFKETIQNSNAMLPEFPEGDAKALEAYLAVLKKVMENGNPAERKNWFPDIESLFKLLSYENVPPYLKGALRDAISTFIQVSPLMKDTIWRYLEQYDLPIVGPQVANGSTQIYDMQYELNEIETRRESYPSTISFINLLNALIAEERDFTDRGRRFIGIFRFIYDHVFGPYPQRTYADPCEKWQLVVACLQHFRMILSTYDVKDEDLVSAVDRSQPSMVPQPAQLQMQLPIVELLKDFMSGKTVFRNIMSILMPGANAIISERTSQIHGQLLERAVLLSLEIIMLVLEKDLPLADFWRPVYQPLDIVLSEDHNQVVALLEYVQYEFNPLIQQCSIKIMSSLSSRMVGLVQLLLKSNAANSLAEDYAACLELRSDECQTIENSSDDPGVLIMQLLIDNISRPAPNITHLLLKFDLDTPIERTVLQPKFHYSCLKVILDILDHISKPEVNFMLHEFGLQLLYELCVDPLTCGPTIDLLGDRKYHFFVKHLETICVAPLPKRNNNQALRISSLHQRAWLLKLLALELHLGDVTSSNHKEACQSILRRIYGQDVTSTGYEPTAAESFLKQIENGASGTVYKTKALELLDIVQFRPPDAAMNYSQVVSNTKYSSLADEVLRSSLSEKTGVYYYSERGDRLIDLSSFGDQLWQKCDLLNSQISSLGNEVAVNEVRETIHQLVRWAWKYNRNLEEQAAQLHMLTGWSQIVEVSVSRRLSFLGNRSEILFQVLDAALGASGSPDCSLKMAQLLTQVALTCMAKLRDERFLSPGGLDSGSITCLDIITLKQLSNGDCLSILFKLIMSLLRRESSEALRRRQYALLLSYFQYCKHMLDPDVPRSVLQFLLGQDGEEMDLEKIEKEQADLVRSNFSILRKEAQAVLELVIKDATHGSQSAKTIAHYVIDALICIDHEKFFLNQLQSRKFLRSCLISISNVSFQDAGHSIEALQRACTLEAELALLLRISHTYGKTGAHVLDSMGALDHLASCKALSSLGALKRVDFKYGRDLPADVDRRHMIVGPVLRLVSSMTSLLDTSDFLEVKNKIVREVMDFVKTHPSLFDRYLQEDISGADEQTIELVSLTVSIFGKVWPYEESDELGLVQGLFRLMCDVFLQKSEYFSSTHEEPIATQWKTELTKFRLCFSLSSYLYFLVTKKSFRLPVNDDSSDYNGSSRQQQPTLVLLGQLLRTVTGSLERAVGEKNSLLNKIEDINELSRQEVDQIISLFCQKAHVSASDNIQRRRYIAMVEMCQIIGNRDQLVTLLLLLAEHLLNVILIHFKEDSSSLSPIPGTMNMIAYTSNGESKDDDVSTLCGTLIPVLERLELLNEETTGHNLKVFRRLASSLKEIMIRKEGA